MTATTLTGSARNRITTDWQRCFPHLGVRKPMSLLKRNGPLLIGIYLDGTRSNDVYVPLFHVHALMWPSSDMALKLCQRDASANLIRIGRPTV